MAGTERSLRVDPGDLELIQQLQAYCSAANSRAPGTDLPRPLNHDRLWAFTWLLATGNKLGWLNFNVFLMYKFYQPDFCDSPPTAVLDAIAQLTDRSIPNAQRYASGTPLIALLPFLRLPHALDIVKACVDIIHDEMTATKALPKTIVAKFGDVVVEDLNVDVFDEICDYLLAGVKQGKRAACLAVLAELSVDIARIREDLPPVFDSILFRALTSVDVLDQMAGCYFLHRYSAHYIPELKEKPPFKRFTGTVFPLLQSENELVARLAYQGVKGLMKIGYFKDDDSVRFMLSSVEDFPIPLCARYFRLLFVMIFPIARELLRLTTPSPRSSST
jgi:hypothetical protein